MRNIIESCRLFSKKDGADKEYQLRLVQTESGFLVEYSNGKRGSALRNGLRTEEPVSEEVARKEYDRVKKSKLKDGYTGDESGEAFVGTEMAGRKTAFAPHLLTACDDSKANQLIADSSFVAQIKHDGERRYVAYKNGEATFANRQGLAVPAKEEIVKALDFLASKGLVDFEFDCEDMGSHLVIFDILSIDGVDQREKGFVERFKRAHAVDCLLRFTGFENVLKISEILDSVDLAALRSLGHEGVCFKRANGQYANGKNDDQYKFKFWETATVRVESKHPTKRSVGIEILDASGRLVSVGNVTVPINVQRPLVVGDLIDVRYLYAFQGGSLFEPTFERIRTDLPESAACATQLKFKQIAQAA